METYNKLNLDFDLDRNKDFLLKEIKDKNILVIGGAGSIGLSYLKKILTFKPSKIIVVDINENGLTELTRDLRSSNLLDYKPEYITYPVNLLSNTFEKIFKLDSWDIIANFSAHKHVRSEKDGISVEALIKNKLHKDFYEITHTDNVVKSTDSPLEAAKRGKDTSMWLAIDSVKKKKLIL